MKIGVLEIIIDEVPKSFGEIIYNHYFKKPQVGIMPQVIAVWCSRLGHNVHYNTYIGQKDISKLVPNDIDLLIISSFTQASALAYATAKFYRKKGVKTALGGPHAKAFPKDALRFFDFVIQDCDIDTINDLINDEYVVGTIINTQMPKELPSFEERNKIVGPTHFGFKEVIPIYSSIGCPYTCDFCVDATSKYFTLPAEFLKNEIQYISKNHPSAMITFHDPNFGVKFDQTLSILEEVEPHLRNEYGIETTMSNIKQERLERLRNTNCIYIQSGIESWSAYSDKTNFVKSRENSKVDSIISHFRECLKYVNSVQGNLIFGTDSDVGYLPIQQTKHFIQSLPELWCSNNIPTPYGGTPLFKQVIRENRVLTKMPFSFYYTPYLCWLPKNYDVKEFYKYTHEIFQFNSSFRQNINRVKSKLNLKFKFVNLLRSRNHFKDFKLIGEIVNQLHTDKQMLSFHEKRSSELPKFYRHMIKSKLGNLSELISIEDLTPSEEDFII